MALTVTYQEYRDYGGRLSEDTFESLLNDAVYTVSSLTFARSESPPKAMRDRVRRCICEVVDVKHSYFQADTMLPRGIGSINNDGYSISRSARNSSSAAETTEQQDYETVCRKYLLVPENLMYAGVG